MTEIFYGTPENYKHVTQICLNNNIKKIPKGDLNRANLFGDPCPNVIKHILISVNGDYKIYEHHEEVELTMIKIPIVTIGFNNLTFISQFIQQIIKYDMPIIILDNASTYPKLFDYYNFLETVLKERITIYRLTENYGPHVYHIRGDLLPPIFILSDADLLLNSKMPHNFSDHLLKLSYEFSAYKVGLALDVSQEDKFEKSEYGKWSLGNEEYFWKFPISHSDYKLYKAVTDTTFCLVNNYFFCETPNFIRIAGDYTCEHLPWYQDYIKENIPEIEKRYLFKNNTLSTLARYNN